MKQFVRVIIEAVPNKYLLMREVRDNFRENDVWNFPGGTVEPNEDPSVTAARELTEETNLNACEIGLILEAELTFSGEMWRGHWYAASADFSEFKIMEPNKCIEYAVLSADEMRTKNISSAVQIVLDNGLLV
ncbi:MAG: NUDIX hydrolase [Alphaproteobacteria bacterium]|nr:NUDIX hydrolase [Alphaproteobacteria bacterium]